MTLSTTFPTRVRGIRTLLSEIDHAAFPRRRSRLLQTLANTLDTPIIVDETVIHPRRDGE